MSFYKDEDPSSKTILEEYDDLQKAILKLTEQNDAKQSEIDRLKKEITEFKYGQLKDVSGEFDFILDFVKFFKLRGRIVLNPLQFMEDFIKDETNYVDLVSNATTLGFDKPSYMFVKTEEFRYLVREFVKYTGSEVEKKVIADHPVKDVRSVFKRNEEFTFHESVKLEDIEVLKAFRQQILNYLPSEKAQLLPFMKTVNMLKKLMANYDIDLMSNKQYFNAQINIEHWRCFGMTLRPDTARDLILDCWVTRRRAEPKETTKLWWEGYYKWVNFTYQTELITKLCFFQEVKLIEVEAGKRTETPQPRPTYQKALALQEDKNIQTDPIESAEIYLETIVALSTDLDTLTQKYNDQINTNQSLNAKILELGAESIQAQSELSKIKIELQNEVKKNLNPPIQSYSIGTAAKLATELTNTKQERDSYKRELDSHSEVVKGLRNHIRDLEHEIARLNEGFQKKLKEFQETQDTLTKEMAQSKKDLNSANETIRIMQEHGSGTNPFLEKLKEWAKQIPAETIYDFTDKNLHLDKVLEVITRQKYKILIDQLEGDIKLLSSELRLKAQDLDNLKTDFKIAAAQHREEVNGYKEALKVKDPLSIFQDKMLKDSAKSFQTIFDKWQEKTTIITTWFERIEQSIEKLKATHITAQKKQKEMPVSDGKKIFFAENPLLFADSSLKKASKVLESKINKSKTNSTKGIFNSDNYDLFTDKMEEDLSIYEFDERCKVKPYLSNIKQMPYDTRMCQGEWSKQKMINMLYAPINLFIKNRHYKI
jgi:uncharacterized protein YukE